MTLLKLKHWTEFRYMEMRCQFFFFLEISQGSLLHFWGLQALEAPLMLPSHLWDTSSAEKGWHLLLLTGVLWDERCSSRGSWQRGGSRCGSAALIILLCLITSATGENSRGRGQGQPGTGVTLLCCPPGSSQQECGITAFQGYGISSKPRGRKSPGPRTKLPFPWILCLANSVSSCLTCRSFSSQSLQNQAQLLAGNKRIPEIIERLGLERTEWFGFTGTLNIVSFQPLPWAGCQ